MTRFEQQLKEVLSAHEVDYNPEHWDELEQRMDTMGKGSGNFYMGLMMGVVAVVGFSLGYMKLSSPADMDGNKVVEHYQIEKKQKISIPEKNNIEKVTEKINKTAENNAITIKESSTIEYQVLEYKENKVTDSDVEAEENTMQKTGLDGDVIVENTPESVDAIVVSEFKPEISLVDDNKDVPSQVIEDLEKDVDQNTRENESISSPAAIPGKEKLDLLAPTAFSPNGDGLNDVWIPPLLKVEDLDFQINIYNVKGVLVYSFSNRNNPWDGRNINENTYVQVGETFVWYAKVKDGKGEMQSLRGTITVAR